MRGLKKAVPLTINEYKLLLKVIFESKNLHGTDFETLVNAVQKIQLTIQEKEENK
jgi:hypothetical protein